MTPPNPARAAISASTALPKLTTAQANALRLADRDGALCWTGAWWVWKFPSTTIQVIPTATVDALERRGCLNRTRSGTLHPSDLGRAWLAANPDPAA